MCTRKLIDYSCLNIMVLAILLEGIVVAEMIVAIIRVFYFSDSVHANQSINLNGKLLFDELHLMRQDALRQFFITPCTIRMSLGCQRVINDEMWGWEMMPALV